MQGMPRRYYDYPPEFTDLHQMATVFAFINGVGYLFVFGNLFYSIFKGEKAEENPFDSLSLEWTTASPPQHDNWDIIPTVDDWTYGYGQPAGTKGHHYVKPEKEPTHVA